LKTISTSRGVASANILATDFNPLKIKQTVIKNRRFGQYNKATENQYFIGKMAIFTQSWRLNMGRA